MRFVLLLVDIFHFWPLQLQPKLQLQFELQLQITFAFSICGLLWSGKSFIFSIFKFQIWLCDTKFENGKLKF